MQRIKDIMYKIASIKRSHLSIAILSFIGLFVIMTPAHALLGLQAVENIFVFFFFLLVMALVELFNGVMYLVVQVATYNNFSTEAIVNMGWEVVRDVSNMFFVLILLVIAIATIIKWQALSYRQTLRRLIVMALLINFSKSIAQFFIDLSQVLMLTFFSAVDQAVQGGAIALLGLDEFVNWDASGDVLTAIGGAVGVASKVGLPTVLMALVFVAFAVFVAIAILLVLIVRIVVLWILLIFSPFAYMASAIPQTKEYWDKWWKTFYSNLTTGPVLAFMLWLIFSITALSKGSKATSVGAGTGTESFVEQISASTMIKYFVGIILLSAALKLAIAAGNQSGVIGMQMANKMRSLVGAGAKKVGKRAWGGRSGVGGIGGRMANIATGFAAPVLAHLPGLQKTATNLRARQEDRNEKRKQAEAGSIRPTTTHAEMTRELQSKRTSPARRAALRQEQLRRGNVDGRQLSELSPAEASQISREVQMGGVLGVRNTAGRQIADEKFGTTAQRSRPGEELSKYNQDINRKLEVASPNLTDSELTDVRAQDAMLTMVQQGRKTMEDIIKLYQGKSEQIRQSMFSRLEASFGELNVNDANNSNDARATRLRRGMKALDGPGRAARYGSHAVRDPNTGRASLLDLNDRHMRPNIGMMRQVAGTVKARDYSLMQESQRRAFAPYLTSSQMKTFSNEDEMTSAMTDDMFRAQIQAFEAGSPNNVEHQRHLEATTSNLYYNATAIQHKYRGLMEAANVTPPLRRGQQQSQGGQQGGGGAGQAGGGAQGGPTGARGYTGGGGRANQGGTVIPGQTGFWQVDGNLDPNDPAVQQQVNADYDLVIHNGNVYRRNP